MGRKEYKMKTLHELNTIKQVKGNDFKKNEKAFTLTGLFEKPQGTAPKSDQGIIETEGIQTSKRGRKPRETE